MGLKEREYIVYKHTAPNGKVYIGITCRTPHERWGKNGSRYKRNVHFTNAINKYGWDNILHEVLYQHLSYEEACKKEIELIAFYEADNPKYGYNGTSGGEENIPNEETRKKMSEHHWNCKGANNPWYGHVYTEEEKLVLVKNLREGYENKPRTKEWNEKISKANKGKPKSEAHKQALKEAKRKFFENGGRSPGYGRSPSKETRQKMREAKLGKVPYAICRPVICLETGEIFESVTDASRKTGIGQETIRKSCKRLTTTSFGKSFRYCNKE